MTSATEPVKIAGYRVEGLLGTGGMSRVYAARQISLDRKVALKVFALGGAGGNQAALRLRREARLLAKLDSETVVRCIDFGEADGYFYLALELVEGETLKQRLDRTGPMIGKDAARIALTIGQALQHAHAKGIVHRDVKPGNVLISRDGRVKLSDFGLARTPEDAEITQPGTALGTPQYLSPEQARSPRRAGPQSDVYSLGATLYHMVAGEPPHQGDTLAEVVTAILFEPVTPPERLVPDLDSGLSRIIARAMAKERTRRYHSALEFNADLQRWLSGQADTSIGISWDDAIAEGRDRHAIARWVVAGTLFAVSCAGLAYFEFGRDTGPREVPPAVSESSPSIAKVVSGAVLPVAAWNDPERLTLEESVRERYESELLGEVRRKCEGITAAARSAARAELALGRLDSALARFDAESSDRVTKTLGAAPEDLPEPFAAALDETVLVERGKLEDLIEDLRVAITERVDAALETRRETFESALLEDRLDSAATEVARLRDAIDSEPARCFAAALVGRITEARVASPPETWTSSIASTWSATADEWGSRIEARRVELVVAAREAIRSFALANSDASPRAVWTSRLEAEVAKALGPTASEVARTPEIREAIDSRVRELDAERVASENARRAERERELASTVGEALARADVVEAQRLAGRLTPQEAKDPWLIALLCALPEVDAAQRAVLASLEPQVGKRIKIATRSIVYEGTVSRVDVVGRSVVFKQPDFEIAIADLAVDEIERRAGAVATPLARAIGRAFHGDVKAARDALQGKEAEIWFPGLAAEIDEIAAEKLAAERGEANAAELQLAEFDAALARNDRDAAALAADRLLKSSGFARVAAVKARGAELRKIRDEGLARIEIEKKRATVRGATPANVEFGADGEVTIRYTFEDPAQLSDFALPGPEWTVLDGRLSSLSILDVADAAAQIDLYRNKPGIVRALPFLLARGVSIEFELALPLDPRPGLFGVRVFSNCFVIRSFADPEYGGQINAWTGTLDEIRDYLFDPALGETRPRKSGGGVRTHSLERGNRYHVSIQGGAGAEAMWTLKIEGEVVYQWKPGDSVRGSGLEIRSEMPCEIDELTLRGFVAGVK